MVARPAIGVRSSGKAGIVAKAVIMDPGSGLTGNSPLAEEDRSLRRLRLSDKRCFIRIRISLTAAAARFTLAMEIQILGTA